MKAKEIGQSIIEMVFAIGILGLVLTGVVALVVKSSGGQTKTNLRDKAVMLGSMVIEEMVALSKNDPSVFWQKSDVEEGYKEGFEGFSYSIVFTDITSGNCTASTCVEVDVTVKWREKEEMSVSFSRFFQR